MSTPSQLCAQIVAPYPPAGRIGDRQPVRQLRVVVHELRAPRPASASAGRSARATRPPSACADYLDFYADDPATDVGLAYVEGVADGRAFFERRATGGRAHAARAGEGRRDRRRRTRAAASHTGSLATDDRVFDGACRQAGVIRAATIEEAFEAAATFATQPLPDGPERVRR